MKLTLFKQNPQVEKYKPDASLRQVESMDLDRKEELEKFRTWMEGVSREKSELPDQKELDELRKQTESGKGISLGLLGVLAAIPIAGLALGGGLTGLSKIADDAKNAILGGGGNNKPSATPGGNNNLLGIDIADKPGAPGSKGGMPRLPKLPGGGLPRLGGGAKPPGGVTSKTPAAPSRPASATPRSNAAGNQVSRGQQARFNSNRSQAPGGTSTPRRPSARARFNANLETGTNFGGRASGLQKRFHKLFSGKNPISGFISKIFKSKVGRKALGKVLLPFFRRIPVLGSVIGTLIDIFIFKVSPGRALFKNAVGALTGLIAGGLVGILSGPFGLVTGPLAGTVGQIFGSWFGDWLYSQIFGGSQPNMGKVDDKSAREILYGKETDNKTRTTQTMIPGRPYNPNASPRKSTTEPPDPEPAAQPLRGSSESRPNVVDQSTLPPLPPTGTLGTGAQMYGASRDGGRRRHAGQDFDAPPNGTFYSRIGGEVIYAANAGGGYGNVVDVYNEQLGVTERIAEGDRNLVNVGDMISAGTPVQQGTAQTGVFHYEIRDGRAGASGSFEGTRDPIAFLNNLPTDLAQVTPADGQTPGAPAPALPRPQQQMQPNLMDRVTKMLEPLKFFSNAFEMMNDREYMDSLVLGEDGTVYVKTSETKPELFPGMQSILDTVEPSRIPKEVSMLSPEAEAAQERVLIINGDSNVIQSGGQQGAPEIQISGQAPNNNQSAILIGAGSDPRQLHKLLMSTKIG